MAYISRGTTNTLICSHPQVKKIWDYGMLASAASKIAAYGISIELNDGTTKDFDIHIHDETDANKLITEVEQYLQTLDDL